MWRGKIKLRHGRYFLLFNQVMKQTGPEPYATPKKCSPIRLERTKKFMRKPSDQSERSSSRKSHEISMKDMYIKTPTARSRCTERGEEDFFKSLASSIIMTNSKPTSSSSLAAFSNKEKNLGGGLNQQRAADPTEPTTPDARSLGARIRALEAELDLRNHESSILSGECQRMKIVVDQEKQKRRKLEHQKRELQKQLKQVSKSSEALKVELKKMQKQKQSLNKQIAFLERINYDDKTRSLQSYREKYLEEEVFRLREAAKKSQTQKYKQLEAELHRCQQQKYNLQSHHKAMKVANQCLIKQINSNDQNLHDFVLNSEQYRKLREKYLRFLEQFKLMRNQYWALRAETNKSEDEHSTSSIFSITASEVEKDLSILRGNWQG